MHKTAIAIGFAVISAAGLAAQSQETKTTTRTKVEIKGGKDVTLTGCVERRSNGDYMLTEARENRLQAPGRYILVTEDNLTKLVGQRVEIKGKAVVEGDGKISVESKTKTEVEHSKDQETSTKTESTAGALDLPFLGVTSLKTLGTSCN